jgi:hypothetical protein
MNLRVLLTMAVVLVFATGVFAADDSPIQARYAANLTSNGAPDSFFDIANTGASGGNICVNVYAFSPDEQLVSCCSCVVTPNGLYHMSVRTDIIDNTLTPAVPGSVLVKLVATTPNGGCNAAGEAAPLSRGLAAWMISPHPNNGGWELTETAFTNVTANEVELTRIRRLCGFIQSNGSGYGVCDSCRGFGGLGGAKK